MIALSSGTRCRGSVGLSRRIPRTGAVDRVILSTFRSAHRDSRVHRLHTTVHRTRSDFSSSGTCRLVNRLGRLGSTRTSSVTTLRSLDDGFPVDHVLSDFGSSPTFRRVICNLTLGILGRARRTVDGPDDNGDGITHTGGRIRIFAVDGSNIGIALPLHAPHSHLGISHRTLRFLNFAFINRNSRTRLRDRAFLSGTNARRTVGHGGVVATLRRRATFSNCDVTTRWSTQQLLPATGTPR